MSNITEENKLAAESVVTPAEIAVLFQGERRDTKSRARERIWSEWARNEYRRQTGAL